MVATEYYLEAAGQSGSGLFYSIELLDSSQRKLKIMTKRGGHVEINCHGHGIVPDDRLFYTADSWTGEIITDEINTEAFTISTSYNEVLVVALRLNMKLGIIISERDNLITG